MVRESERRLDRRTLLAMGSTTLAGAVAGCLLNGDDRGSGTAQSPPETDHVTTDTRSATSGSETGERGPASDSIPYSDEFGTVVDVVRDAGADPDGEASVRPILDDRADDDTLLYFPPGRYLMDGIWTIPEFTDFGIVGDGATIVPKRGYDDYLFVLGLPGRESTGIVFEGIEFDFRAAETAPRPIQVQVADGMLVQDVDVRGSSGTSRFDVTRDGGSGVVRRLRLPDGGRDPTAVGILVSPENVGSITFENCRVQGFPNNGIYASPSNGPVTVRGGYYANNAIANVRVSDPAVVRGVHVRCDRAPDGFRNMRGIRLRHGESVLVEDCTVEMREVTYSEGAIVVEPRMASPTIRNVDVEVAADGVMAINAKTPAETATEPAIACEDVRVTGSAGTGSTIRVVDRDECSFDTLDVEQTGPDRDGIYLVRSRDTRLRDARIDVTGDPFVLEESEFERRNVTVVETGDDSQ